jgi:hypothetical protein
LLPAGFLGGVFAPTAAGFAPCFDFAAALGCVPTDRFVARSGAMELFDFRGGEAGFRTTGFSG